MGTAQGKRRMKKRHKNGGARNAIQRKRRIKCNATKAAQDMRRKKPPENFTAKKTQKTFTTEKSATKTRKKAEKGGANAPPHLCIGSATAAAAAQRVLTRIICRVAAYARSAAKPRTAALAAARVHRTYRNAAALRSAAANGSSLHAALFRAAEGSAFAKAAVPDEQ